MSGEMDLIQLGKQVLGIGVGGVIGFFGSIYVSKSAITTAVTHAANKEIERLKRDLARELERERQEFTRQLETERAASQRELESFKSELTLAAEVRRQVAARKVDALMEIIAAGESLGRRLLNAVNSDAETRAKAHQEVTDFLVKVRSQAFLFEATVAKRLQDYAARVLDDAERLRRSEPDALTRSVKSYNDLLDLVRAELGVTSQSA